MIRDKHAPAEQKGFTIIELMIATLVFAVIIVVISSGVIHFTTAYYKGINTSATQTAARTISNVIAQNLQYGGGKDDYKPNTVLGVGRYLCIGSARVDYNLGHQLNKDPAPDYGAVVSTDNCTHTYPPSVTSGPKEYLGPNMRVTNIDVTQIGGGASNLYSISVGVAYGDIDLLCTAALASGPGSCAPGAVTLPGSIIWTTAGVGNKVQCKSISGSQFCAVSHLTTQVVSRFAPGP